MFLKRNFQVTVLVLKDNVNLKKKQTTKVSPPPLKCES